MGRYLTDTTGSWVSGYFPHLMDNLAHNEDGTGGLHLYMPWWLDDKKLDFPRGYHIEFYGGRGQPEHGIMGGVHKWNGGGYGKGLKEDYRRLYGATIGFAGRGEMIPNPDSYCEIDPDAVDKWGIPVLRFHFKWSDHELQAGPPHAGDVPRADRRRWAARALQTMPDADGRLGHLEGRRDHPRGGHDAHGRQPEDARC